MISISNFAMIIHEFQREEMILYLYIPCCKKKLYTNCSRIIVYSLFIYIKIKILSDIKMKCCKGLFADYMIIQR